MNSPSSNSVTSRRLKFLAVYLLIWTLVLAAFASQLRWGIDLPWPRAIVRVIAGWSPWIVLAPLVWWLANRFSVIEKKGRVRSVCIHLVASITLVVLAETMIVFVVAPVAHAAIPDGAPRSADLRAPKGKGKGKGPDGLRTVPRRRLALLEEDGGEPSFDTSILAHKAQFWFPLYWVLVFLTSSTRHFRESQEREKKALQLERDLATARLSAIQSRLEPHFFFNTLNSISSLVHSDPDRADEMIAQLSDLLRRVLARSETQQIELQEELDLLREYLSIQKIRFPKRLQVEEEIDKATLSCLVPTLLLQPLAENAVRHGIEPKTEPSTLQISSKMLPGDQIELVVEDDGLGWENTQQEAKKSGGFGLSNIRSRLEALYPGEGEVQIATPEGGGTRVSIRLPAVFESAAE